MIITTAEQLRNLTSSYYANNDFSKIENIVKGVEHDICRQLGLSNLDNLQDDALLAAQQAVGYMATMRFYRLNDISHENAGRKVKMDKENEARPFEWQLARDDRAHLEEYYRALDRLIMALQDNEQFRQSRLYQRIEQLIVKDADTLSYLTGLEPSPWLYIQLTPYLAETQRFVEKCYGDTLPADMESAQKAVAIGAIVLMGRHTSLQTLPYGLMQLYVDNGGGNKTEQPTLEQLKFYLKQLSDDQRYWIEEMKLERDRRAGHEAAQHLQMPENDKHQKYMRV